MSELRPGWLVDDVGWREQLDAIHESEARWLDQQWEIAGGAPPRLDLDLSWITMEPMSLGWGIWPLVLVLALISTGITVICTLLGVVG